MNPLKQYIELFREHRSALDGNSAPVMNALRDEALAVLESTELPDNRTEGYAYTSLREMYAPDYGVNVNRVNIPVDVAASFHCGVPGLSTMLGVVVNDMFRPSDRLASLLPSGVEFCSLREAAQKHPELVASLYGKTATLTDPGVALNTLLVQDGVFVHIGRGVTLEKPLQLVNIFSSPGALLAARRVLIYVEDNAEGALLCCDHTQDNERSYLSNQVVEIVLGRNARFGYYDIEESSEKTSRHCRLYARQQEGSNLVVNGMTLTCGTTRNDYNIDVAGEGCETFLGGMAIESGTQHVDNASRLSHLAPHGHSTQLFKYVVDGEAKGVFDGRILVAPEATHTEAYQSNRNLLASTTAKMYTRPQLEIYCDDVKCSHGATTGQLDAEALFYMQARGIPEAEARVMLMQAFMADVIDTVRIDSLRERLRLLVEKRFVGRELFCGDCAASHRC